MLAPEIALFDEIVTLTINDDPAAYSRKRLDDSENALIVFAYDEGKIGVVIVGAAPDELDHWLPTALAIAESIQFSQP